jgi:hypothetical protein
MPSEPGYLIPGEHPQTPYIEDVRHWITIYSELIIFNRRSLDRIEADTTTMAAATRSEVTRSDQAMLRQHIERLQSRVDFWHGRLWELGGVDFDARLRTLGHRGKKMALTKREAQLLSVFLARPGRFFTAEQLLLLAWHAPSLSTEQIRSYIVRLRRTIKELELPAEILSEPRQGYALSIRNRGRQGSTSKR